MMLKFTGLDIIELTAFIASPRTYLGAPDAIYGMPVLNVMVSMQMLLHDDSKSIKYENEYELKAFMMPFRRLTENATRRAEAI